jgi:hypothetical protein
MSDTKSELRSLFRRKAEIESLAKVQITKELVAEYWTILTRLLILL